MSKPELLAARKELLAMRAELQRMELSFHVEQARASLSWAKMLTGSVGRFLRQPGVAALSGTMGHWFKDYPMLATVGSLIFARMRKPIVKVGLKAAIVAAVTVGAYWFVRRDAIAVKRERWQAHERLLP